ncbi:MAG: peptide deformylase [Desulfuromonadaceae bacterium]|nr:peptide deformylase [Desulfuromonadaceae bacterium]
MSIRAICHYPDPVLTKKAQPVAEINDQIRTLVDDMVETMYAAPGVGLAAPQIGVLERVVVIDCGSKEQPELIRAINPEILEARGESNEEEGCLSVPGYYSCVKRSAWVRARYQTPEGEWVEREADGLLAVAFQHEIDHLDGHLFVDRLSSLKKSIFRKKYQRILEQQQEQL